MEKKKIDVKKLALAGVLMALVIVSILFIKVPIPYGYAHIADSFILVSGVLGPFYAFVVGGIGAMIADIIVGYLVYAPWSLVVHGLQGIAMALLLLKLKKPNYVIFFIASMVVSTLTVVVGYALAELAISGTVAAALATLPINLLQVFIGSIIGTALYAVYKNFIQKLIAPEEEINEIKE